MALGRLHQLPEAQTCLNLALEIMRQEAPKNSIVQGTLRVDWLTCDIFLQEAQGLVGVLPAPNNKINQKLTDAIRAVSKDQIAQADSLVAEIPASQISSEYLSRKYADLFRLLGQWHVGRGDWKLAVARFAVLFQLDEPTDVDPTTRDYLRYGTALIKVGNLSGYESFRAEAAKHFAGTTNYSPVADRVIKICLLTPAGTNLLQALQPMVTATTNFLAQKQNGDFAPSGGLAPWQAFALALWEYRRGDYSEAEDWCLKSSASSNDWPKRAAGLQPLLAMARFQLGKTALARTDLTQARNYLKEKSNLQDPEWYDFVLAQILLDEAQSRIGDSPKK